MELSNDPKKIIKDEFRPRGHIEHRTPQIFLCTFILRPVSTGEPTQTSK